MNIILILQKKADQLSFFFFIKKSLWLADHKAFPFVGTRTDPSESLRRTHAPFDGTSKVQMCYFWKK